ncbi:MAG: RidA family protein [Gemmatimonadetes bacterium]|nr:RidA family protein [Gemmatimonadota bacterium]
MSAITPIHAPGTVRPVGHYSQAIIANGFVFVSGQLPSDLTTGTPNTGTIEEQTALALANTGRILEAAGSSLARAVQMTIFIARIEDWGAVNQTYARIMGEHRPTRAIVPVSPLHHGTGIEIQCIATLPAKPVRAKRASKPAPRKRSGRTGRRR